ncbi:MAG: restriction endonuclease, partial [Acidimicrobiia bacterium]|nr:restriction endonuclease [Acidimicrobiia bacterium]
TVVVPGALPLFSNEEAGGWSARPKTVLVDSTQLESGEAMSAEFKAIAAREIEEFKAELRQRFPGRDTDDLTDEALLREVMNTVGKPGKLGEQVRCVVSVSMLTEGWDANTVTHILGIRPFRSQLLCEQVVGRGLRRRSYVVGDDGRFAPEYAEVYGVPFAFMPSDRPVTDPPLARPGQEVRALDERSDLRITFPLVEGYRVEIPDEPVEFDHEHARPLHVDRDRLATWTQTAGLVGGVDEQQLESVLDVRPQQVAYEVAAEVVRRKMTAHDGVIRPWLFPALIDVTRRWLDEKVTFADDTPLGSLRLAQFKAQAAEAVFDAVVRLPDARTPVVLPILRRFDGEGSTDDVFFVTRKAAIDTTKSHVSHVVLDGVGGNTWEEIIALRCELHDKVAAYVKNDHLGFEIPYTHKGRSHRYVPDFLVRLVAEPGDVVRTLIVEVSGGQKSPGPTAAKAATARDHWCTAVNNHGGFGRWGYVEIDTMENAAARLDVAIDALYADEPIIGQPVA